MVSNMPTTWKALQSWLNVTRVSKECFGEDIDIGLLALLMCLVWRQCFAVSVVYRRGGLITANLVVSFMLNLQHL